MTTDRSPPKARLERFRSDFDAGRTPPTILAVCPNSRDVVAATLDAAHQSRAPAVFAATLNQVDTDGGYTGWTPAELAAAVNHGTASPLGSEPIIGLDHGGPFKKDAHLDIRLSEREALAAAGDSLRACIAAGYEHLHIDATGTLEPTPRPVAGMVGITIDLMTQAEACRAEVGAAPISYEVGVEEVSTETDCGVQRLRDFLEMLWPRLEQADLPKPVFVVGNIGTKLDSTNFAMELARRVVSLAADFGAAVKAHYTDDVARPELYPVLGIGGANVGPGLAAVEFASLRTLGELEKDSGGRSLFFDTLERAFVASGRWRKWTAGFSGRYENLPDDKRAWLLATGSRYVWEQPDVREARLRLYSNVSGQVDGQAFVRRNLKRAILRYHEAFRIVGLLDRMDPTI